MYNDEPLSFDLDAEGWEAHDGSIFFGDAVAFLAWARAPHRDELADQFFMLGRAASHALRSGCGRSRRGVAVWSDRAESYALGTNGPPPGYECSASDECKRTCGQHCEHAEISALLAFDGPRTGVQLLHVKVDEDGMIVPSGPPSCLPCATTIARSGIVSKVWLFHGEPGHLRCYSPEEFYDETLKSKPAPGLRVLEEAW